MWCIHALSAGWQAKAEFCQEKLSDIPTFPFQYCHRWQNVGLWVWPWNRQQSSQWESLSSLHLHMAIQVHSGVKNMLVVIYGIVYHEFVPNSQIEAMCLIRYSAVFLGGCVQKWENEKDILEIDFFPILTMLLLTQIFHCMNLWLKIWPLSHALHIPQIYVTNFFFKNWSWCCRREGLMTSSQFKNSYRLNFPTVKHRASAGSSNNGSVAGHAAWSFKRTILKETAWNRGLMQLL
jgi:hypothetical protein